MAKRSLSLSHTHLQQHHTLGPLAQEAPLAVPSLWGCRQAASPQAEVEAISKASFAPVAFASLDTLHLLHNLDVQRFHSQQHVASAPKNHHVRRITNI